MAFTVPQNVRSRAVMDRLGMSNSPADDFDHPSLPEGHRWRRQVLYRIQASEFKAAKCEVDQRLGDP